MPRLTNATKAQIIVAINAILSLVGSFGLDFSNDQQTAITVAANAILGVWVGLTYKDSPKRTPD